MSKISKSRFVGISEQDLEEFTCGICLDILVNPVVTQCCGQTYCSQCINQWLIQHNTCPLDRRLLCKKGITPAPKMVNNLINNMKIKCYFQSNGCQEVIPRHELSEHEKCCQFSKCKTCGFTIVLDNEHNCIEILLIQIESINDENKRLLNENSELKKKNENLNKEIMIGSTNSQSNTSMTNSILSKNIATSDDNITRLKSENSELMKKNDKLNKDNSVLIENNTKLESYASANNVLKDENFGLKVKNLDVKDENLKLKTEFKQLKYKLQSMLFFIIMILFFYLYFS